MLSPFASSVSALLAGGFSPLPIVAGEKRPAIPAWSEFCARQPAEGELARWARQFPQAGVGIALGPVAAIDIDSDDAQTAIEAVLPALMVGKRGAKGATYLFRNPAGVQSRGFKAGRRTIVDLLAHGRQTVLPPSIHPGTGQPYVWTTARTLADTSVADLPELPADIVERIEAALAPFGYSAEPARPVLAAALAPRPAASSPTPDLPDEFATLLDEINTRALADLSWVPALNLPGLERHGEGWRSIAPWRPSSSGRADGRRSANLSFYATGIRDFGSDEGFRPLRVVELALNIESGAAIRWLGERLGFSFEPEFNLQRPTQRIEPTYPDTSVPLADALALIDDTLDRFHARVAEFRIRRIAFEGGQDGLVSPTAPALLLRAEMGLGKTHAENARTIASARAGVGIVRATRTIALADQTAKDLNALAGAGFSFAYRGWQKPDPEAPSHAMCRNLPAARAAWALNVDARAHVCNNEKAGIVCPFATTCGVNRQAAERPVVPVIATAKLFDVKPASWSAPDLIVVDEACLDLAFTEPSILALDELRHTPLRAYGAEGIDREVTDLIRAARSLVVAALDQQTVASEDGCGGYLDRQAFEALGIDASQLEAAARAAYRLNKPVEIHGRMSDAARETLAKSIEEAAAARRIGALLWALHDWLKGPQPIAGAIRLVFHKERGRVEIEVRRFRPFHPSWGTPAVLFLDATAPDPALLNRLLDSENTFRQVAETAVTARLPDAATVSQVALAPTTATKLWRQGQAAKVEKRGAPSNRELVLRHLRMRAAMCPGKLAVVAQKRMAAWLKEQALPANVEMGHFGALAGLNTWKDVRGMLIVGRPMPTPDMVEPLAAAMTGAPPVEVPAAEGRTFRFYPEAPAAARLLDGSGATLRHFEHPDPNVAALVGAEAEVLQAIGRARLHWRTAEKPCWIEILNDQPLPLAMSSVGAWRAPEACWDVADGGVLLTLAGDLAKATGMTADEARTRAAPATLGHSLIESNNPNKGMPESQVVGFTYRRAGRGGRDAAGISLPHGPRTTVEIEAWLNERLGPLAWLKVDEKPSAAISFIAASEVGRLAEEEVTAAA